MTPEELTKRLKKKPSLCQTWISAIPINEEGVVYLSSIGGDTERLGTLHIYFWGKKAMRQLELAKSAAKTIMAAESLDRFICEIDIKNSLAIRLAERAGFNRVGVLRRRKNSLGEEHDVLLMDALPGDL